MIRIFALLALVKFEHFFLFVNGEEGEELNDGGIITWGRRRSLEEGDGDGGDGDQGEGDEEVLLLAKKRTQRRDPLDHWKKYNGGWNITNEHYLTVSSVFS